jgi:hypothetical protein
MWKAFPQVGINTEAPNRLVELDVCNRLNATGDTIPKGIMIPRIRTGQRDAIDISDATNANSLMIYNVDEDCFNFYSREDGEWKSVCGAMGKANFTVDCSMVTVHGEYGQDESLDASNYLRVTVNVTKIGSYSIQAQATPDNGYFFELTGTFFSTGSYTLTVPGFGQPKKHTQGPDLTDPKDDNPDQFTLSSSGGGSECTFKVDVIDTSVKANFSIRCGATVVLGTYFEDVPLSATPSKINNEPNQLEVTLENIPAESFGATAVLKTNEVDGISFYWEGILTSSPQVVNMQGKGVPRGLNDKVMTITGNSQSDDGSCTATVHMLIPAKRLMALGQRRPGTTSETIYSYNPATISDYYDNCFNALLTDKENFGYNQWSVLKFAGFTNVGSSSHCNYVDGSYPTPDNSNLEKFSDDGRDIIGLTITDWKNTSPSTLEMYLKGTNGHRKVDIFMIAYTGDQNSDFYNWYLNNQHDRDMCQKLVDFVKSGGILIIFSEQTTSNQNFLNLIFDNPDPKITSGLGGAPGSNYTLGFNSTNTDIEMRPYYCKDDDPILRGPFEDILGRNWAEDASTTTYFRNLPLDEIVIYSGANPIGKTDYPKDGVTIFRHKEYPFIFIGDAGFNSSESRAYQNTASTICPFDLTNKTMNGHTYTHWPTYRKNMNESSLPNGCRVYNAVFTANAFAWSILQAEEYRRAHK